MSQPINHRVSPIVGAGVVLIVALLKSSTAYSAEASVDLYFTNDAALQLPSADQLREEWTGRCVAGGEFAELAASYGPDPKMNHEERKTQAAKFDRDAAVRIVTDAWRKADAALPHGPLHVCIDLARQSDDFTRHLMGGVAAVTAGAGRIVLRIHPDADWKSALPYVVAHEMHHSYWVRHHFDADAPFTLADYLVFEGRADYFAGTLFTHSAPWTKALDADTYAATWQKLSKDLNSTDWELLQSAMFGAPQTGIPRWAGYSIGHRLVSNRMARTPTLDLPAMSAASSSAFMPTASAK